MLCCVVLCCVVLLKRKVQRCVLLSFVFLFFLMKMKLQHNINDVLFIFLLKMKVQSHDGVLVPHKKKKNLRLRD